MSVIHLFTPGRMPSTAKQIYLQNQAPDLELHHSPWPEQK